MLYRATSSKKHPEKFQRSKNPIVEQFIKGRAQGPLTDD